MALWIPLIIGLVAGGLGTLWITSQTQNSSSSGSINPFTALMIFGGCILATVFIWKVM